MYDPAKTRKIILSAAKSEFLDKGFDSASMRTIAKNANVTTGALYQHHKDKNALFDALVGDLAKSNRDMIVSMSETYLESIDGIDLSKTFEMEHEELTVYVKYLYDNQKLFFLLLCRASGSIYGNYLENISTLYYRLNLKFIQMLQQKGLCARSPLSQSVYTFTRAYVAAVYGVISDEIDKKDSGTYVDDIIYFFNAGWKCLLGL